MKERRAFKFLTVIIALLLVIITFGVAEGAEPENIPEHPGCVAVDHIEWDEVMTLWGGWVTKYPYNVCGVAVHDGNEWLTLFEEDCSNISSSGQTTCYKQFDNVILKTFSMKSDPRIEGFLAKGWFFEGVYYIPIPAEATGDPLPPGIIQYRRYLPMIQRFSWVIGPPPVPEEE